MTDTLLPGIDARTVPTTRLRANVLERTATASGGETVVFVHGNVSSSLFWQPLMLELPAELRALAIDLRGFGASETLPVDATRGVRDFSDDIAAVLDELGIRDAHVVGWSLGAGVVLQLLLDRPDLVASVTLESPVSPYGFGGTAGPGGRLLADGAGTGGGAANPDFVARLQAADRTDEAQTSPRTVYRSAYVKDAASVPLEDLWVESMLTTATGEDNYAGDLTASEHWPGFAPGGRGVLNTIAPTNFDVSGVVDLPAKPPVLWIHGTDDAIVADGSFFDLNHLGAVGVIPGWPGDEVAPAQPMKAQTRAVLNRYREGGGAVRELELAECGHSPHLEHPAQYRAALVEHIAAAATARTS